MNLRKEMVSLETAYCDLCKKNKSYDKCPVCNRDICYECEDSKKTHKFFRGWGVGYSTNVCLECWNQSDDMVKAMKEIEELWEESIRIRENMRKKALKIFQDVLIKRNPKIFRSYENYFN